MENLFHLEISGLGALEEFLHLVQPHSDHQIAHLTAQLRNARHLLEVAIAHNQEKEKRHAESAR